MNDKILAILEGIKSISPSYGVQPFTVLAIDIQQNNINLLTIGDFKKERHSFLILFAEWENFSEHDIKDFFLHSKEAAFIPELARSHYVQSNTNRILGEKQKGEWAAYQIGMGVGGAMWLARKEKLSCEVIYNFNKEVVEAYFSLKAKGLKPSVIIALGPSCE